MLFNITHDTPQSYLTSFFLFSLYMQDLLSSAHADPSLKHVTTEYLTNLTKLLLGQD